MSTLRPAVLGCRSLAVGLGERRFERGDEVEHLGRRLDLGLGDDLLARRLALDEVEQLLAVLVVVLLGLELVGRERLDELARHRALALGELDVLRPRARARRAATTSSA